MCSKAAGTAGVTSMHVTNNIGVTQEEQGRINATLYRPLLHFSYQNNADRTEEQYKYIYSCCVIRYYLLD